MNNQLSIDLEHFNNPDPRILTLLVIGPEDNVRAYRNHLKRH